MPFVPTWMDLGVILNEVIQTEKDKYISFICGNLKKKDTNVLIYKTQINIENTLMVTKGEKVGRDKSEFGIKRDTLLCLKIHKQEDLLYSIGNYSQYLVIIYNGTESEKQ